jgi:hypothetical protein
VEVTATGRSVAVVVSAALGAVLGALGARVLLVGSGLVLLPWAVAALAIGALVRTRREAVRAGGAYGFALAYLFMIAAYGGPFSLASQLVPFLVFGAVGAVCGAGLAALASRLRHRRVSSSS